MTTEKPKLYALSSCLHCEDTAILLDECEVEYDYIEVDYLKGEERKAVLAHVKEINPRCSFPTIIINGRVIVGYQEDEIRAALRPTNEG